MSYRALEYAFGFDLSVPGGAAEAAPAADRATPAAGALAGQELVAVAWGAQGVPGRGVRRGGGTRHVGRHECGQRGRATRWHGGAHVGGGKSRLKFLYSLASASCQRPPSPQRWRRPPRPPRLPRRSSTQCSGYRTHPH